MGLPRDDERFGEGKTFASQIDKLKATLAEADVDSAEVELKPQGFFGITPVLKSVRIGKTPIEVAAQADPGNISQVAASQLEISNTCYNSVLGSKPNQHIEV